MCFAVRETLLFVLFVASHVVPCCCCFRRSPERARKGEGRFGGSGSLWGFSWGCFDWCHLAVFSWTSRWSRFSRGPRCPSSFSKALLWQRGCSLGCELLCCPFKRGATFASKRCLLLGVGLKQWNNLWQGIDVFIVCRHFEEVEWLLIKACKWCIYGQQVMLSLLLVASRRLSDYGRVILSIYR
jgi:hypothetical protein